MTLVTLDANISVNKEQEMWGLKQHMWTYSILPSASESFICCLYKVVVISPDLTDNRKLTLVKLEQLPVKFCSIPFSDIKPPQSTSQFHPTNLLDKAKIHRIITCKYHHLWWHHTICIARATSDSNSWYWRQPLWGRITSLCCMLGTSSGWPAQGRLAANPSNTTFLPHYHL